MLGFILLTALFVSMFLTIPKVFDYQTVRANWEEYRCRPDIMMFADLFGYSSTENIEFCLKNGFNSQAREVVAPFYTYLEVFVNTLMTLLSGLNSIRMTFTTIVSTVSKTFTEFGERFKQLFFRIQMGAIRMKYLMGRIFGTVYAILFMGMAGIQAVNNFGNTFLFKFLDTFCFDPDTPVVLTRGIVPIRQVCIGDIFAATGTRVTSTFKFSADGQSMVTLGDVLVSTNHYVKSATGKWIRADEHPDAKPAAPWAGGVSRPLICLNTETHSFPVGNYEFCDYDETSAGDHSTMEWVSERINGSPHVRATASTTSSYTTAIGAATLIKTPTGTLPASSIRLGDRLTLGRVIGIVKKEVAEWVIIDGVRLGEAQLVWDESTVQWKRASELAPLKTGLSIFYSFVVSPSACFETSSGLMLRDYVEVHSPEAELSYTQALTECKRR
jgi:hypothetical protein